MTASQPGLMMPDFVAAIFSSVSPSTSVWSRPMLQMTAASGGRMTFVASNSPPMPTSHTTRSQRWRAKYSKPSAVTISNSVGCSKIESARGLMYSVMRQISSSEICTPSIWMRSLKRMRIGAGVQARLVSGLCEHAGQHRAGRTLAVRAGHVDEFQLPLGVAHFVQKRADALETGDTALPADGMDIIQRFVKRHDGSLLYVSDFFSYLTGGQSLAAVNTLDLYSSHTTATSITNVTPNWIDRDASFVRKNAVFASPP